MHTILPSAAFHRNSSLARRGAVGGNNAPAETNAVVTELHGAAAREFCAPQVRLRIRNVFVQRGSARDVTHRILEYAVFRPAGEQVAAAPLRSVSFQASDVRIDVCLKVAADCFVRSRQCELREQMPPASGVAPRCSALSRPSCRSVTCVPPLVGVSTTVTRVAPGAIPLAPSS